MIEPVSIDSIEVVRAIKACRQELTKIAPFLAPELTANDLRMWQRLISDEFGAELVRVGYLKDAKGLATSSCFNAYASKVDGYLQSVVSRKTFVDWCKDKAQSQTEFMNGLEQYHQKELGLPEDGYEPSDRLKAGRKALAEYQEAQRGVDPLGHTPLFEKLKEEVAKGGWTLEDFLEISEVLP